MNEGSIPAGSTESDNKFVNRFVPFCGQKGTTFELLGGGFYENRKILTLCSKLIGARL
jgi:hypothetical protein